MYGLSTDTDVSALHGSTLTFVGFGQHQLQLVFSGDTVCSISIEGNYNVAQDGGDLAAYTQAVAGAGSLLPMLGHAVTSATVPRDGTLRLVFDDASVFEALDSSSEYESFQVRLGSRLLVV